MGWGRGGRAFVLAGMFVGGVGATAAAREPPPDPSPSPATQRVIAGRPQYNRSAYFKWHFGEGYRKLWTAPFDAPVLDLSSYAGGLTPVRQVGSMQSIGLALKGADGKAYTFRTLDKDPTKILPEAWRNSFPATIFQDQTTASHPGAAVVIPPLAEAAGIPHTNPVIVVMPDDPALGEFRKTFGGKTGTIDEFPTPADKGYAGFHGATEILSTAKLWERWKKGEARVDARSLLRARIFDLFLGDWDRHNGQWRFMRLPGRDGLVAFPEDRDQAFSNYSGALMASVRPAVPRLIAWRDDYANLRGLVFQGREVDDWLINGLERAAFEETARDVQGGLTNAVIEDAVHRLPPEWFAIQGQDLIRDLKKRRDLLPKAAVGFYERLAKWVDVQGTDADDVATLTRAPDGSAVLELSVAGADGRAGTPYFRRRFLPGETEEVRVYLYGGADRFVATGPPGRITFRVAGGPGRDRLDDSQSGGTRVYDVEEGEVVAGRGTDASSREWVRVPYKAETPWMEKQDYGSITLYQPLLWWEPDPGVVLSMGAVRYGYSFREQPYGSMQRLAVEYKTKRTAFGASYTGDFRWARPGFTTLVELSADGAKNYNFFGIGNETPFVSDDFNEAHQKIYSAFPSLVAYENERRTLSFAVGPEVKFAQNAAEDGTLIATEQPYGFGDFGQMGAKLRLHADTRGRRLAGLGPVGLAPGSKRSDTGLKVDVEGRMYPKAWDVEETFGLAWGEVTGYWQAASWLTLATRVGGQKNWGRYPWHESAFIGGSDSVRGYDRNRFAGDSSLYGNGQLIIPLFPVNLIVPMRMGFIGLGDIGRVWVEGEPSDRWHPAVGGGIFLRVLTTDLVGHALFVVGDEGNKFYVNIGFGI